MTIGYHDPVYTDDQTGDVPIVVPVGYHDPVYTPNDSLQSPAPAYDAKAIGIAAILIGVILGLS